MNVNTTVDFCLLIPCYNNFAGLIESLKSVIYTKHKWLAVVVDDGSDELVDKKEIINKLGEELPVVVLRNKQNAGITVSLNNGLHWINENTNSKYIARLDCGDTCDKDRFHIQASYLDVHPAIGLLGSWCRFIEKGTDINYIYRTPTTHKEICKEMYFRNVFIHPTVMFRTALLETAGYYPNEYPHAEDYAYFWTLLNVTETHVVDKILVTCDITRHGISFKNKGKQLVARRRVVKAFGRNAWLKLRGILRLHILFLIPKGLSLRLKQWKK
jgi:glycosyltransferase involved in cell wall biosynthesis